VDLLEEFLNKRPSRATAMKGFFIWKNHPNVAIFRGEKKVKIALF
jgi:hypothetical protein